HPKPGFWADNRGIGPQFFVDGNGSVFALIGQQNLAGNPRETWHGEYMNAFTLGIENGDVGDANIAPGNGTGPQRWRLSSQPAELTGMKVHLLLHPAGDEDVGL